MICISGSSCLGRSLVLTQLWRPCLVMGSFRKPHGDEHSSQIATLANADIFSSWFCSRIGLILACEANSYPLEICSSIECFLDLLVVARKVWG